MSSSKVVTGVIAGATVVGALIGVLYAPDKGSETRKKLARRGEKLVGGIKQQASNLTEMAKTPSYGELHEGNGKSTMPKAKLT